MRARWLRVLTSPANMTIVGPVTKWKGFGGETKQYTAFKIAQPDGSEKAFLAEPQYYLFVQQTGVSIEVTYDPKTNYVVEVQEIEEGCAGTETPNTFRNRHFNKSPKD
jgi:hypothetical protein